MPLMHLAGLNQLKGLFYQYLDLLFFLEYFLEHTIFREVQNALEDS